MGGQPDAADEVRLVGDPALTVFAQQFGPGDPTAQAGPGWFAKAWATADGPVTLKVSWTNDGAEVGVAEAWGPGAATAIDEAADLFGAADVLDGFDPQHPLVRQTHRRFPRLRISRGGTVVDGLVMAVLGQRVTTEEALSQWRQLTTRYGVSAPGPLGLRLPVAPSQLATLASFEFHRLGIERARSDTLRRIGAHASRLEAIRSMSTDDGDRRLRAVPGIGPWTISTMRGTALGDPDAVPLGDYGLPGLVCHALAGEDGGTDDRMVELLEEFRGHRWRVIRLLYLSGVRPVRRAPRARIRSIRSI